MLDAIVITDGTSPYGLSSGGDAQTARNVGYLYNNDYVVKYTPPTNGKSWTAKWENINDGSLMIGCESDANKLCKISSLSKTNNLQTGTDIYYTSDMGWYKGVQEFGVATTDGSTCNYINIHMNTTNICAIRGMRLPIITEVKSTWQYGDTHNTCSLDVDNANGIPRIVGKQMYTATPASYNYTTVFKAYLYEDGISGNNSINYGDNVRCVR